MIDAADLHMQIWLIDTWDGSVSNAAPDEHDELAWVDRSGIGNLELAHAIYPALFNDLLSIATPTE